MTRFITDPTSLDALALLSEPIIAFDVETNTESFHWKKTHKRGLSYCADMTEIAFYAGPHLPTLVLSASPVPAQFVYEAMLRGEDGLPVFEDKALEMQAFRFSSEQLAFITAMFNREDSVTFVAHNLVFDARQVFGKLGFEIRDNFTLWDTRSIQLLHSGWMPDGWDDELDDDEEEDNEDEDESFNGNDDKNDLLSVYERMVGKLDPLYKSFLKFMKGERPNFPVINFEKFFSFPEVVEYSFNAGLLVGLENTEALATYLLYQFCEKSYFPTKTSPDPDVFHQALNLLIDTTAVEVNDPQNLSKNELRKRWKVAVLDLQPELEQVGHALMEHYVTFDVIAAFEIYQKQFIPPAKYPKYPKLLIQDLEYIKWCAGVAARGIRVDRNYAKIKLAELHEAYRTEILAMGLEVPDWDRVRKTDFAVQYIFWNNEIDHLFKDEKNYAKNVKAHIASLEKAGEEPRTAPPTKEIIKAFQFELLTRNGKIAFKYGKPIKNEHFSFGKKACDVWLEHVYPDKLAVKNIARIKTLQGAITYLEMLLRETECDGRAHTLLGRFAVTGRTISSSPNLQNVSFDGDDPITDMSGIFIADPGYVFLEKDYSNAENFTATMYSGDPGMAMACTSTDFHAASAAMFFPEAWADADAKGKKKLRKNAKVWRFGSAYGMGVEKFAATLRITIEEAERDFRDRDAAMYPYLAQAKQDAKEWSDANGYIGTWAGRRMRIGKRYNEKAGEFQYAGYTGWNSINQGGVGDIVVFAINKTNAHLRDKGYKTYIATQVHDSLVIAMHLSEYPQVAQEIIEIMSTVLDGEVREKWSTPEHTVYWNDSTSPAIRWLTELDNMGNSKKWGKVYNEDYPFALTEYVNRWGVHQMTEAEIESGKAPTWINQWGYGEAALAREMGVESFEELISATPNKSAINLNGVTSDFNWAVLQMALRDVAAVMTPMQYNEKIFDFPEAMAVREQLLLKGQDNSLKEVMGKFDKLAHEMEKYQSWKQSTK